MKQVPISVIIPFSRPERYEKLVSLIKSLQYDGQYEVLLVLNNVGGWQPPKSAISTIRVLYSDKLGPSSARNKGILSAQYLYQVFIDDDCNFSPNILQKYNLAWEKTPQAIIVGGKVLVRLNHPKTSVPSNYRHLMREFGWCFGQVDYGRKIHNCTLSEPLFTANMGVHQPRNRRYLFSPHLGKVIFNDYVLFGEDCLFCYQRMLSGEQVLYCPSLQVVNLVSPDRFTWAYVIRRVILAGIERQIIDTLLRDFDGWFDYSHQIYGAFLQLVKGKFAPMRAHVSHFGPFFFGAYYVYKAISLVKHQALNIGHGYKTQKRK